MPPSLFDLTNKTAIVTGGGRGLGRAMEMFMPGVAREHDEKK